MDWRALVEDLFPQLAKLRYFVKGTPGFIHCFFKVASLAMLNKQMLSSLATYDALSLVNHKAWVHLVWVYMVDIGTALTNSW